MTGPRYPTEEALVAALRSRGPLVVVVDAAEGFDDDARALLIGWAERCDLLRVIATTNTRLALPGTVLELGPMSAEDST